MHGKEHFSQRPQRTRSVRRRNTNQGWTRIGMGRLTAEAAHPNGGHCFVNALTFFAVGSTLNSQPSTFFWKRHKAAQSGTPPRVVCAQNRATILRSEFLFPRYPEISGNKWKYAEQGRFCSAYCSGYFRIGAGAVPDISSSEEPRARSLARLIAARIAPLPDLDCQRTSFAQTSAKIPNPLGRSSSFPSRLTTDAETIAHTLHLSNRRPK